MSIRVLKVTALVLLQIASGQIAGRLAARAWSSVVDYASPYTFTAKTEPGPERDWRVVLVVVDGLGIDASRRMPGLNGLRAVGADLVAAAGLPSYSRPGRANLVTGAPPEIHGATTNRHRRVVTLDNLFRGVSRTKGDVAIVGTELWRSLFGPDLERAFVLDSGPKDTPGAFDSVLPAMYRFEWDGLRTLLARQPRVGVLDLVAPDYAAHEFGAASPRYALACGTADRVLQYLLDEVDLWRTLVVVTADHGHLAEGGHGGDEPEVVRVPLVLAGRGIRAGARGAARQTDVAPTIAALLGLPIPAGSEGRVLTEVLDFEGDVELRRSILEREAAQKAAFREDLARSLDVPEADPDTARAQRLLRDQGGRVLPGALVLVAAFLAVAWACRESPAARLLAACAGVTLQEIFFRLLLAKDGIRLSLSAINNEEHVKPYFAGVVLRAGLATLAALAIVVLVAARRGSAGDAAFSGLAAAYGTTLFLVLRVLVVYWSQGLSMTWRVGSIGRGFDAVLDLARIQAASVGLLVALPLAMFARWLRPRAVIVALAVLAAPQALAGVYTDVPQAPDPKARWLIYLHGRIVEVQGKEAVHPEFGPYAFDAIVKALATGSLEVIAELRPATTTFEYSSRVVRQVRQLEQAGVPPGAITVVGFSKGAALARRAAAELGDPNVGFAILAGCPKKPENLEPWVPRMAGRMLSLYDSSDEMVGSCKPAFEKAPGVKGTETVLSVGKRHGTFFEPRPEWVKPVLHFATKAVP